VRNFNGPWDQKKIVELNTNDVATFQLKVKIQGPLTEVFAVEKGLRQGDALSATLFRIVLEKVIRNEETSPNGTNF
jgi:phage FluMu protein gp41